VRTEFIAPKASFTRLDAQRKEIPASLWGLNGSASLKDKQVALTVVNPHHNQTRETEIAIRGGAVKAAESRTLTSTDLRARNSFANPKELEPKSARVNATGPTFTFQFAPASVTCLLLTLS
jgi:alpha-L-arabinofuranosidase